MQFPRGYHITWGTYGTRLPGCERPHVDRDHNQYGAPLAPSNPAREEAARRKMRFDPMYLTMPQRVEVDRALYDLATRYGWTIHSTAPQSDHVHVVITAPRVGDELRDALKAVVSRHLNKCFGKREWWAEKGSARYLWEEDYFRAAVKYVRDQRDF